MTPEFWEAGEDLPEGWPQTILTIIEAAKFAKGLEVAGEYPIPEVAEALLTRGDLQFHLWTGRTPEDWPDDRPYNSKFHLLMLMQSAVVGIHPDSVSILNDSYSMHAPVEKVDAGTSLEAVADASEARRRLAESRHKGSMQAAWAAGEGPAYGISEIMSFVHAVRTDDESLIRVWMGGVPYVLDDGEITWHGAHAAVIDPSDSGLIPQTLLDAFSSEDSMSQLDAFFGSIVDQDPDELISVEDRRHANDMATLRALTRHGGIVMVGAPPDDPQLKRLQEAGIVAMDTHHNGRAERRRQARHRR